MDQFSPWLLNGPIKPGIFPEAALPSSKIDRESQDRNSEWSGEIFPLIPGDGCRVLFRDFLELNEDPLMTSGCKKNRSEHCCHVFTYSLMQSPRITFVLPEKHYLSLESRSLCNLHADKRQFILWLFIYAQKSCYRNYRFRWKFEFLRSLPHNVYFGWSWQYDIKYKAEIVAKLK